MKRRLLQLMVPASLALALVLSGCGGDDDETAEKPPAQPRLTKQQLVKKMKEICEENADRQAVAIEKYDRKHGVPTGLNREEATTAELEREFKAVSLPIVKDTIRDLETLRPPQQQEAKFEAFIQAMEYGVEFVEEDASFVSYDVRREPFMKARLLSVELGTVACGEP